VRTAGLARLDIESILNRNHMQFHYSSFLRPDDCTVAVTEYLVDA
jgi:hypothetical protein